MKLSTNVISITNADTINKPYAEVFEFELFPHSCNVVG